MTKKHREIETTRLEYKKGTSNKFYEVRLVYVPDMDGYQVIRKWGRIGTLGDSRTEYVGTESTAWDMYADYLDAKEAKGYKRVSVTKGDAVPKAKRKPLPKAKKAVETKTWAEDDWDVL